ncbi:MAG: PP2C family protein-serine/threonine phosphatase [Candidatus Gracilibacteria bacterium]|nr:PP2C family protein-serine/threonine phosphatase [Candidatus Gracilibacteria bacterium]
MFFRIFEIFKKKQQDSEMIDDFDDALFFIKTYEKAQDYKNAIMAIRELILKHKSGINYYEETLKKLYMMEVSNIESVSNEAKAKKKIINAALEILNKRLIILNKRLKEVEKIKTKKDDKLKFQAEKEKFKFKSDEIKDFISKKDYAKALSWAKKFIFEFQGNKDALKLLQKVQKLHDADRNRLEKSKLRQEKMDKLLGDMGVDMKYLEDKARKITFWDELKLKRKESKRKAEQRDEYVKKMKTIGSLEKLIAKSGSIDSISQLDMSIITNEETFNILSTGLIKDLKDFETYGFDFFGKIFGKDKIIGDTFGHFKTLGNKVVFYFGDATGHGQQAGITVAVLSKVFIEASKTYKKLSELVFDVNNSLKGKIKGKSFVTGIFFEWDYARSVLKMVGAGHPPLFIYRREQGIVEKIIPGGLALGVRNIANLSSVKMRDIPLGNGDTIFGYTDGIVEIKNVEGTMFGINGVEKSFEKQAKKFLDPEKIYNAILADVEEFKGINEFDDDVSFFIYTRNFSKDLIANKNELEAILKETNSKKSIKDISFKKRTKEDIMEELKKEKQDRELKIRLERLDRLAKIGEYIKLKQEVLVCYKEGYVHSKMKYYLEKAIANEQKVIVKKMEEKLQKKYDTLTELYKKGEYEIIIKEAMDVIFKNGKI